MLLSFAELALDGSGDHAAARLYAVAPGFEDVARRLGLTR